MNLPFARVFVCISSLLPLSLRADVRLPSIFSDHIVLTKAEAVPMWGKADPGEHVRVTIGGKTANVSYAGLSPGFAGLYQINFTVPSGLAAGNQPIVLTIDKISTPAGAFLAVK